MDRELALRAYLLAQDAKSSLSNLAPSGTSPPPTGTGAIGPIASLALTGGAVLTAPSGVAMVSESGLAAVPVAKARRFDVKDYGALGDGLADDSYAVVATDYRASYTSLTAARTVTLPAANTVPAGLKVIVKDESGACSGTNTITVSVASAGTIDGAASKVVNTAYGTARFYSNGAQWMTE